MKRKATFVSVLLAAVLLFLQPDASMSGAFAMAVLPALWHGDIDRALRRTVWGILTVLAVLSWAWLKSPEPVAQAEGILTLASASGTGWWLMGLLSLAALIARIVLRMPDRVAARQGTDAEKIFVYGSAAFTVMRLNKRAPAPGETPLLFARRMDRQKAFPTPVLPLWRMMAMSHYSRVEPGPEHTARARECFWRLYKPQRPLKKLRFMLAAAFGKGCYTCLDTPMAHVEPEKRYTYAFKQEKKGREKGGKPFVLHHGRPPVLFPYHSTGRPGIQRDSEV